MINNPLKVRAAEFNLAAIHSKSLDAIHLDDKQSSGLSMRGHFAQRAVQWFHKDRVKLENADVTRRFLHAISNSLQEGNDFAVDSSTLSDEQRTQVMQKVRDRLARQYEGQSGLTAGDIRTTLLFVTQLLNPQVQVTVEQHPRIPPPPPSDLLPPLSSPISQNAPSSDSHLAREPLVQGQYSSAVSRGASDEEIIYEEVVDDDDESTVSSDASSNKDFEEIYDLGDGALKRASSKLDLTTPQNPEAQVTVEQHPKIPPPPPTEPYISLPSTPSRNVASADLSLIREPLVQGRSSSALSQGASGEEIIYEEVIADENEPTVSSDASSNKDFEEIYDLGGGLLKPASTELEELDLGDQFADVQEHIYEDIPDHEVATVTEELMRSASQLTRRDSNASFVSAVESQEIEGHATETNGNGADMASTANQEPVYHEVSDGTDTTPEQATQAAAYERPIASSNVAPQVNLPNPGADWFNLLSSDNPSSPIWQTLDNYPGVPRYTKSADVIAGTYDNRLNHMLTAMGNSKFGRPDPSDPENQTAMVKQCLAISRDVLLSHWMRVLGPESEDSPVHAALKKKHIKPDSDRAQQVTGNYSARMASIIIAELQRIARDHERNHETEARIVTTRLFKLAEMIAEQAVSMSGGKN